jgi:hypothetical protein
LCPSTYYIYYYLPYNIFGMEDLDDKIAAKLAAKKKIKGKRKRRPADDERENKDVVVGQLKSPPELHLSNNQLLSSIAAKPSEEGRDSKDSSFEEDAKIAAVPVVAVAAAASKKPGAYAAKSTDVSAAERLKFGTTTTTPTDVQPASRPGAYSATTEDVSAAERLKFGIVTSATVVGSAPGAYATSNEDTSAAERLKFGIAVPVTNDAQVTVGGFDPNTSEYSNSSLTNDFWAGSRQQTSQNENEVVEAEIVSEHSSEDDDYSSGESYDEDIDSTRWRARRWRNMFIVSSIVLVIIIVGLSVALASATKPPSQNTAPAIIDESGSQKQPTSFPSMSPSLRPVDISWCFTDLEYLENYRYSSLRSALVMSGLSSDDEFSTNDSYQRKALCWLVFGDGLQLDKADPFLEQRYALATLFYSQNEPIKLRSSGWLSNKHECNWTPMVQCDIRTGSTVSKLNITNFNLEGKLPKELSSLQYATHLDASQNLLDGGIAEATSGWIDLQELRLANNRLEAVPQVLGAMTSMTHLDISGNSISGAIPEFLAFMNNLIHLDISSNSFNSTIPDYMGGNLPNLSSLYMHSNQLTGNMPQSICNLRQRSLSHLSVDCGVGREIQCDVPLCCTVCNGYDF